jgi:hypothetical protein
MEVVEWTFFLLFGWAAAARLRKKLSGSVAGQTAAASSPAEQLQAQAVVMHVFRKEEVHFWSMN